MATEIKLPRLGQGMESGTIVKWLKSEGDNVEKGEPLYELDTDKVTQEVEADASGVLLRIAVQEGEVESRPLSNVRRTIARRLTQAWAAPVFQLTFSADMTRANALVGKLRERNPDVRITITDILTKVCASALMRHREVNVQYADDALLVFPTANVGIAVAAPSGLIVPVIQNADRRSIVEIAAARADLVGRAKDGKLQASDLEGGTFTISNLGMYGVEQFVAVLNPPQAAILAVAATEERAVVVDGALSVRPMMTMTGTFDHRAVDGAAGADFLRSVKEALEEPGLAL